MRVIAGQFKGHRLFTPKDKEVRPTTDRTREYLFSIIGDAVNNAAVLDLFAGTGSFGIEALSRNAEKVIFVDQSGNACELVRKNLDKLGIKAPVYRQSAKAFICGTTDQYDIIFCDPPYRFRHLEGLFQLVRDHQLLAPDGWLIYESASNEDLSGIQGYKQIKEKKMGNTKITVMVTDES